MKVGIDVLEINRIKTSKEFLNKILTENEIEYIEKFENKKEHVAGFFCVKEAVFKALNLKVFSPKLIEVNHDENNKPFVVLQGEYLTHFKNNYKEIEISISHSKTIAQAICIIN